MQRRTFLKSSLAASASLALGVAPRLVRAAEPTAANPWRKFEAVTRIEVTNPTGVTRVWVPVPLLTDTDYFKRGGDTWTGNARSEEHTSELQSLTNLVCRLLLEKKKKRT